MYAREYDKDYPVVCMDEKPFQLIDERIPSIPMSNELNKECHMLKEDGQYERKGTCSIFMFTEVLASWRHAEALPRRTSEDWARKIQWLLDDQYPDAKKVVLVMDNLNTHCIASLYKVFTPQKALELAHRLEIHYTPKHGSWLDIAEIELSAMTTQCLGTRRIPTIELLNEELASWECARNKNQRAVDWQFTTDDARVKLKHLYPVVKF